MHRRSLSMAVALVALVAMGVFSSVSLAATTSIPYEAEYTATFGHVKCVGEHQTNAKKFPGTEEAGGRDKFKCTSTTGPFVGLTAKETGSGFPGYGPGYESDYFLFVKGKSVISKSFVYKVNGKDTAFTGLAYY
jgi:hypothetical protein